MILGSGLLQSSGWTPTWLIRDEFTDTVAAGSVDGTAATPGPGTRTVTDTGNLVSVESGTINIGGKTVAYTDPIISYGAVSRAIGTAILFSFSMTSGTNAIFGLQNQLMFKTNSAAQLWCLDNQGGTGNSPIFSTSYNNSLLTIVFLSTGGLFLQGDTLLWVGRASSGASAAAIMASYDVAMSFDYVRVTQLPAPFDSDTGLATDVHAGSVSAGTTFAHEANALIEYTVTMLSALGNIDVLFRVQDASNYWICRTNSSGDISLQEVVAGSATQRSNTAGVVANGHRIVIIADGTTIKVYSNNTLRITYASATNFATATAGEVDALGTGGVVSDLKTWPRTLSGEAAAILNKASA